MITEGLLNVVFVLVERVLSILPDFEWTVNANSFDAIFDVLRLAGYLLPMGTIVTITAIVLYVTSFKIAISLIKTIWELLPLV